MHEADIPMLEYAPIAASNYGVNLNTLPKVTNFIEEGDTINLEIVNLKYYSHQDMCQVIYVVNNEENIILSADVLFHLSIGRTDLPMGDNETLINSIKKSY